MQLIPAALPGVPRLKVPTAEQLREWRSKGIAEALDGCVVEADGECVHGDPSWLVLLTKDDATETGQLDRDASEVNRQLQIALTSRVIIEQAKGFVCAHLGTTADEAFWILRTYSRQNSLKIRDVCEAVMGRRLTMVTIVSASVRADQSGAASAVGHRRRGATAR